MMLSLTRFVRPVLLLGIAASFESCSLFSNAIEYQKTGEAFIEAAIREDYDACINLFALERPEARGINTDTLKKGVADFRNIIVNELGTDIKYNFISSNTTFSASNTLKDITEVRIEISNREKFDQVVTIFDDRSKKILNIRALNLNKPIPSMTGFWLFGLVCLCVPAFNVYMVVRLKRSDRKRKWLKYCSLIFLNVPTFSYNAATGFIFKTMFLQIMLGFSFNLSGYLNSRWELGIPVAGLYWLWSLSTKPNIKDIAVDHTASGTAFTEGLPLDHMNHEDFDQRQGKSR